MRCLFGQIDSKTEVRMQHDHVFFSSSRSNRSGALRFIAAAALVAFTMLGGLGACESEAPPFCVGGVVKTGSDGQPFCEGKCDPASCLAGNTCVDNRCVLECNSHDDCLADGSQNCTAAVEDGTGRALNACLSNGVSAGVGTPCPLGNECETVYSCRTNGKSCNRDEIQGLSGQCGGHPEKCILDDDVCYARPNCTTGKCPDGSECTATPCQLNDCIAPLACVTKGNGDADAYCANRDCAADSDCPGGYYCGVVRDPREICDSSPKKGDSSICGTVSINTPCIDPSELTPTFYEGQACAMRNTCIKREECAACESDLDCRGLANHCVGMANESTKRCARECASNKDCGRDFVCQAVEGAGNVCVHRFGACVGTGQFCEPCLNDADCGPPTGTSVCFTHNDGQRGCGDISFPFSCSSDADCPTSPSGLHAICVLDDPTSNLYKKCYIFAQNALDKYTCW